MSEMEKGRLLQLFGIAVVIVVISAIISLSITENASKVQQAKIRLENYTKKDVDSITKNFTTKQAVLDALTNAKIVSPYITGEFLADGQTPNEYCQDNGHGNCILVINSFRQTYYNSTDLNCSGGINYINQYSLLNGPANCNTEFDGAFYQWNDPRSVVEEGLQRCLTGGEADSDNISTYSVEFICAKA